MFLWTYWWVQGEELASMRQQNITVHAFFLIFIYVLSIFEVVAVLVMVTKASTVEGMLGSKTNFHGSIEAYSVILSRVVLWKWKRDDPPPVQTFTSCCKQTSSSYLHDMSSIIEKERTCKKMITFNRYLHLKIYRFTGVYSTEIQSYFIVPGLDLF